MKSFAGEGTTRMRAVGVYERAGCRLDLDVGRCNAGS